ncbi:MAG: DUF11 domain-containing protein [Ardenticatenaceae bacterium]|nr:DUF11 domain-containing protein [Ardenticatenaceae bacterium]MCB9445862.1 DUF11 domain-containing protein [Ardenticatenaceae bacterium]
MNSKSKNLVLLLIIIAALAMVNRQGFTQEPTFSLPWFTFDGGGGRSSGDGLEIVGTIGQPDAGTMTGGAFSLSGGFWQNPVATDAAPDLSITQTVSPTVAAPGQIVTYILTFRNDGDATATGVTIDYKKPSRLLQTTYESKGPTVSVVEDTDCVMHVEDLAPGMTGTVVVTGVVDPSINVKASLVSTAVISADNDAFSGNNQAEVTLVVQPTQYEVYLPAVIR